MAKLGIRQLKFLELYLADGEETYGNATKSYLGAYPSCKSEKTAAVEGSKLLRNPKIAEELAARATAIRETIESTAETVLERAEDLFLMALGEKPCIHEKMVSKKQEDGTYEFIKVTHHLRNTNLAMANQILQTIGRNRLVQAFQDNLEVSHTHYIEEQLAHAEKQAEERARLRLAASNGEQVAQ